VHAQTKPALLHFTANNKVTLHTCRRNPHSIKTMPFRHELEYIKATTSGPDLCKLSLYGTSFMGTKIKNLRLKTNNFININIYKSTGELEAQPANYLKSRTDNYTTECLQLVINAKQENDELLNPHA
jgi:hypothetical protein